MTQLYIRLEPYANVPEALAPYFNTDFPVPEDGRDMLEQVGIAQGDYPCDYDEYREGSAPMVLPNESYLVMDLCRLWNAHTVDRLWDFTSRVRLFER